MKAIVQDRFGPPDVLKLMDIDRPSIGPDEVLVQVHAAGLNPYDWHMPRGDPRIARLFGMGLTKPKERVAGLDAAGTVAEVGANVQGVRPGDEVLGFCPGAFAEYARAKADKVAPKPANLSFEEAAGLPIAATTALRGILDVGEVRAGHRVLITGAGGGVGSYAVQIAAHLGAEVTGVCSQGNVELVRELGAAHVIDYAKKDYTGTSNQYDVILDNVGKQPLSRIRSALATDGTLVHNAGGEPGRLFGAVGGMLQVVAANGFDRRHRLRTLPVAEKREELLTLTQLIEKGRLKTVVSRTFPLADTAEGVRYLEQGHARGKAVISVV